MSIVVVQHIEVIWTKASRGADQARIRNNIPESFALPDDDFELSHVLHSVSYHERNRFRPNSTCLEAESLIDLRSTALELVSEDLELAVRYHRDGYTAAESRPRAEVFRLTLGNWGRLRYSIRRADLHGLWIYEKHVFNVAFVRRVNSQIFTATEPAHVFSAMTRW